MLYNTRQSYTPPLEAHEFNRHALVVDTETVGSGPSVEIVELALCDHEGRVLFDSLVRPAYNRLPRASKDGRFDRAEFDGAPAWEEVWPEVSALIDNKLLVAYNAAFDRRALAAACARHRQESTERGWRCAMQFVKRAAGVTKNLMLADACARYGLEGGNHRAARDALATQRLLAGLIGTIYMGGRDEKDLKS